MAQEIGLSAINQSILRAVENSRSNSNTSLSQIGSGNRLTSAGIDPAGSALSSQLRSEIAALSQASENTSAGANFLNTADAGLSTVSDLVARGRELALQASNGTLGDAERQTLNNEFTSIRDEIDRIAGGSEFNGQNLLDGNLGANSANQVNIQVGTESGPENQINLNVVEDTSAQALGIDSLDISTAQGALNALAPLEQAQSQVTAARGEVGATANRLSSTAANLGVSIENFSRAENEIAGTDIAETISNLRSSLLQTRAGLGALQQSLQSESLVGRLLDTQG